MYNIEHGCLPSSGRWNRLVVPVELALWREALPAGRNRVRSSDFDDHHFRRWPMVWPVEDADGPVVDQSRDGHVLVKVIERDRSEECWLLVRAPMPDYHDRIIH